MGLFGNKQQPIPPQTKGAEHAVPCPHCGAKNNFAELKEHQADVGDLVSCDKCDGVMQIAGKQTVTVIHVRRINQKAKREAGPGGAATISAAQARRMLGR